MRSTRLALIPLVLLAGSCSKKEEAPAPATATATPPAPPAQSAPAAEAAPPPGKMVAMLSRTASITGEVKLEGKAPEMQPLKRGVDPVCAKKPMNDEQVLARDGKLQNVVVWISQGAPPAAPPSAPAKLEQVDCMYRPRVQAIQEGQGQEVHNADKTLHNVRAVQGSKSLFNKAQLPGGPAISETVRSGVTQFKCDVHPWMKAYAVVVPNQYSAVTGEDGHFAIQGLLPGHYTVTSWHELFGRKTTEIDLQEGKATPILFEYSPQDRE